MFPKLRLSQNYYSISLKQNVLPDLPAVWRGSRLSTPAYIQVWTQPCWSAKWPRLPLRALQAMPLLWADRGKVSGKHTIAPSMTASAFRCSPAPRNSHKMTTAISWQNSVVLPLYPLLSMDVVMKDIGSQNVYNSVCTPPANLHPQMASLQDSITKHISVGWRECRLQLEPTARK